MGTTTIELDVVIGTFVVICGGLFGMLMRHSARIQAHANLISQLQGRLDGIEARTELAVRKVLEGHEEREMKKFDVVNNKLNKMLVSLATLAKGSHLTDEEGD
jgi:hypothetical protein